MRGPTPPTSSSQSVGRSSVAAPMRRSKKSAPAEMLSSCDSARAYWNPASIPQGQSGWRMLQVSAPVVRASSGAQELSSSPCGPAASSKLRQPGAAGGGVLQAASASRPVRRTARASCMARA
jgi:hypothetical protein